jgi:hypothetical protein
VVVVGPVRFPSALSDTTWGVTPPYSVERAVVFSVVCDWSRVVILKMFCLTRLPLSWSFGWREQAFLELLYLHPFVFPDYQLPQNQPGIDKGKTSPVGEG